MFWAKVELINLEPTSEAQRIPGYTIDSLYHRILYPSTEEGGFHPFLAVQLLNMETRVKRR